MRSKKLLRQIKKNFSTEEFETEIKQLAEVLKSCGVLILAYSPPTATVTP